MRGIVLRDAGSAELLPHLLALVAFAVSMIWLSIRKVGKVSVRMIRWAALAHPAPSCAETSLTPPWQLAHDTDSFGVGNAYGWCAGGS